jgi:predicted Zn-dependent protease
MRVILLTFVVALALGLAGCYTVPETGRRSVIVISPGEESAMGASAFADLRAKQKVSEDPEANARVRRVGKRIAEAVGKDLPGAQWEFVVFDDAETVNAFALPGGKVGVYTGLLKLAESDDELATVMGHEIGHVTARHGAERMTEGLIAAAGGLILDTAMKDNKNHDLIVAGYGVVAGGGMLVFSRQHESEADFIGIRYAARAGYNPAAAITFWQKMAKENKAGRLPAFLSTHPSNERRIADLQQWIPSVLPLYEAAKKRYE